VEHYQVPHYTTHSIPDPPNIQMVSSSYRLVMILVTSHAHQGHHINSKMVVRRKVKKKLTGILKQKLQSEEDRLQALMEEAKSDYESNNFGSSYNNNLIYKYISALSSSSSLPQQMYLHTDTTISD